MKLVVYVLCYDDKSTLSATEEYAGYPWARVVTLPDHPATGKYMEGGMFLSTLRELRNEWHDADFVGTLSWKASEKIDVSLVGKVAELAKESDVIALLPAGDLMIAQAVQCHPRFLEVWVPLLVSMGYDVGDTVSTDIPSFFCNYWLATPCWMDRFLDFYGKAAGAMDTLPSIQGSLWSDSFYGSHLPRERLEKVFGRPYVTYHPFIGERLASFFFWKEGAGLAKACLVKREYWETRFGN